ncbi:MAG: sugar transferase [Actinomycetes bacterium]
MNRRIALTVKRMFDVLAGFFALAILAPVMIAISVAVLVSLGRPILFSQARPGLNDEVFILRKFRTMRPITVADDRFDSDEVRTSRVGHFLRRTSLDELPELFGVLVGKMSLVGPRPLVPEYLPLFTPDQRRRHDMRPGMTGLAQVSGRRDLTLSQRLSLDTEYVDAWSLGLDLRILWRTIVVVLRPGDVEGQTLADVDDIGFIASIDDGTGK